MVAPGEPSLVKPKPLSHHTLLLLSLCSDGGMRTRKGQGLAPQVSGKSWVPLPSPGLFCSCPPPSPFCHTSSEYDISLQMARMPANASGTLWHKGALGNQLLLALWQGGSFSPPSSTAPPPALQQFSGPEGASQLALACCFQNTFTPTPPGMCMLFQGRELFSE